DARPWAGQRPFEMDYTGSLAKVCAMYAAFALRDAVNRFLSAGSLPSGITSGADPQAAVFAAVSKAFDDTIATAVPLLGKLPRKFLVPTYGRIFTLMGDEPSLYVDFAPDFRDDMEQMVIHSITNAAGRTIQALGYGWINGALQAAGFFRPGTKPNGLWLAGDYLYANSPPDGYTAWPTVTIRSENDGLTKQNTTCIDLARLLVLIRDGRLVDEDTYRGNTDMADIMRQGAHAMQIFLTDGAASITERWNVTSGPLPFEVVHNKIGIGDLKPDVHGNVNFVHSELSHIVVAGSGRDFVVAWQNQPDTLAAHERIRRIVTDTITKFLEPS
ncbi:MAG TPA: hypothetical protein VFJ74_12020, partial [Gemmatimonadaceae bacterium]|nr:hypothetical protein [Gemmatimonadaceae bacterium]